MMPAAILAVDDDDEFLLLVRATLEAEGYEVHTAATAGLAFEKLRERRFDLVLADLRLPSASGLDVLQEARRIDALSVGIIVTGHSSVNTAIEALREGAYDYLAKPCASDVLIAAVRRGVEHYRLKLELMRKTQQLETVSHELKNPLSVVYGYSSFLLKHPEEFKPEDVRKSLQSIHNNAERLSSLLDELLESVRLSNNKVELERQPVSVAKLCQEAAQNALPAAAKRGLTITVAALSKATVQADARRIQQVLGNLVSNAIKFTPSGGSIVISAHDADDCVRFSVGDTGVGIAPDDLEHLFERFYQAPTTRKDHAGLGLGLDICKGLVELHGGRIWAESEPGRGSTFHFTLPLTAVGTKH